MTDTEKLIYLLAKTVVSHFDMRSSVRSDTHPTQPGFEHAPFETPPPQSEYAFEESQSIQYQEASSAPQRIFQGEGMPNSPGPEEFPKCPRHGKFLKPGKYGPYCTSKEADPRFSNKNGYCNFTPR